MKFNTTTTKSTKYLLLYLLITLTARSINAQVGINTTTPSATLDVVGEPTNAATIDGLLAPRVTGNQLRAKTGYGAAQEGALVYVTTADSAPSGQTVNVTVPGYYFFDGSVWQLALVGGGLTPDGDAWGVLGEDQTGDISRTGRVVVQNDNLDALTIRTTDNTVSNGVAFRNSGTNYSWNLYREDAGNNDAGFVIAGGNANPLANLVPRLRINSTGEVGIGNIIATSQLDVNGGIIARNGLGFSGTAGSQLEFGFSGTTDFRHAIKTRHNSSADENNAIDFYIWDRGTDADGAEPTLRVMSIDGDNNGEVGIGTANPRRTLHVQGTQLITSTNAAVLELEEGDTSKSWFMVGDGNNLDFREDNTTGSNTRLTINPGGNVGVGVTPTARLDINGNARVRTVPDGQATDFVLTADANGNIRRRTTAQVVDDGSGVQLQTLATAIVSINLSIPLTTTSGNPGSTPGETVNQITDINFNLETVDPGNNFDLATDTYIAPQAGSYLITLTASPNPAPNINQLGYYYHLNLQVFNRTANTILADNRNIRYATPGTTQLGSATSLQAIVSLNTGDAISARIAVIQSANAGATETVGISNPNAITFAPQTQNRVIFSVVRL